jgi:hypothetical protein
MRQFLLNATVVLVTLVVGFLVLEIASRWLIPIPPQVSYLRLDGTVIHPGTKNPYRMVTGKLRQVGPEFDVAVTITDQGLRVPEPRGPVDVAFLGDSFTFGQGLNDAQTFPYIYCAERNLSCVNLGHSGSGTLEQMDILEHFLDTEGWRPREVKLFMLVMTGALMSGNDLADNVQYAIDQEKQMTSTSGIETAKKAGSPKTDSGLDNFRSGLNALMLKIWGKLRYDSNLVRVLYYNFAPSIKVLFSPGVADEVLISALQLTSSALQRFDRIGKKYGFEYQIYLLHPVQDLVRGTSEETVKLMRSLAPDGALVHSTNHLFPEFPQEAYHSIDGHFNIVGSRLIADYLLRQTSRQ